MGFWDGPQGAATLKLGVLGRYLGVFSAKTGSTSPEGRICYFDGFAGRGFYDDGSPGSPATAAKATEIYKEKIRTIDGFLVEKDRAAYEALRDAADQGGWHNWQVRHGVAEDHVQEMLQWAGSAPLLAFLDPFALGVPYEQLLTILRRPHTTEVLLNISKHGIRRFSGHLTGQDHRAKDHFIDKLDDALGGTWWQPLVTEHGANDSTAQRIAIEFCDRIRTDAKYSSFRVPVRDRIDGPIDYYLLLLTRHPDGLWHFNDVVSKSTEEIRKGVTEEEGKFYFDPADELVECVKSNITTNIDSLVGRELRRAPREVFGEAAGRAREMHVRKALTALHDEGVIANSPKGFKNLSRWKIQRP